MGCNIGGLLHTLSPIIHSGVGIDCDPTCINAANIIKALNKRTNIHFFNWDLIRDPLEGIPNFVLEPQIDICFLLSMCMWLENWQDVIRFCSQIAQALFFESNGSVDQQNEQRQFLDATYATVQIRYTESLDDPRQNQRMGFLCTDPKIS